MRWLLGTLTVVAALAGCGRYDSFTLPPLDPSGEVPSYVWDVLPEPVLTRGAPGAWDAVDALNPSVIRRGELYFNLYSGFDGQVWRTGLATSPDGATWTKTGQVISPDPGTWEGDYIAANGHVLEVGSGLCYWYQAGRTPRIGMARGSDGRVWTKHPEPVLDLGPRGSWDELGVADPYVLAAGGRLYMYYLGQDRARRQRLGVAVSDDGVRWTKHRDNPILELGPPRAFDEVGLGEPAVWIARGRYWMLYTARDHEEYRRLGLAVSSDGVDWERVSDTAVLAGDRPWNAKVVCDPTIEVAGEEIRVWFGGGDVAAPAENLNGQIGLARLRFEGP